MSERIGPYRLIREIGRGGMGAVHLAERDGEFTQRVAIKRLRGFTSDEAVRRFQAERRILASLDHPNIARLVDGGETADGLPYLVMEYVDGVAIDRFCDDRALTMRQRIELFLRVCGAVSDAHRRLVVHSDLKPSNILVTAEGTPKLLDFGIAKLVGADGRSAEPAGRASAELLTASYASPEQARGDQVTTATDVYSLGVLLFELLTGRRPYQLSGRDPAEIERVVCFAEPPKPSAVAPAERARALRGDVDTIVLKALRKEPERRYVSVEQLADDLTRFLDGLPVLARPATWTYVGSRFVRRHRAGVAAAAAFAATVVVFAAALGWSAARARHERDAAERVTSMLIQTFSGSDPRTPDGDTVTVGELLDRGAAAVRRDLDDRVDVQAGFLDAVGEMYSRLGLTERAGSVPRAAPPSWNGAGIVDSPAAAMALNRLADSLRAAGQPAAAEPIARRGLEMNRRILGRRNPQVGLSLYTLGTIVHDRRRLDEAERIFAEMIDVFRESLGPQHAMVGTGLHHLALVHRDRGDLVGAERLLQEAIAIRRWMVGQVALDNVGLLADIVRREGRSGEAEQLLGEAAAAMREAHHPRLDLVLTPLADLFRERGRLDEAEALDAEARSVAVARLEPR